MKPTFLLAFSEAAGQIRNENPGFKVRWVVPYSQKYWRSLNLVVWPQTKRKKYWWNLNLVVAPHSVSHHYKHCEHVYQGVLPSSRLRYLNKTVSSQIYKKYNWQCVSRVEGHRAGWGQERYSMYVLRHYALQAKIILADFNLAVSTLTTKPPNLNPRQIFRLYGN